MRSQVISQRAEGLPPRASALWKISAVSITRSMFFRDSGMASDYRWKWDHENRKEGMGEYGKEVATKGENSKSSQQVGEKAGGRSQAEVERTSKSLEPACMYLSMKSKMVSQRAAKVESDSSGDRCCRKTYDPPAPFSQE